MPKTILITGANRGIGLEFVKQYANEQCQVIACCRNPSLAKELTALNDKNANVDLLTLDINNQDHIEQLKNQFSNKPLDCLINNAGVYGKSGETFATLSTENMINTFSSNVCGTLSVCQALLQPISKSQEKMIVTISSKMGSIDDNQSGSAYAYRASKTALNAVMKSLAIDTKPKGIRVLILHPGWVKTDMGGPNAAISTEKSVTGMRHVIDHLDTSDSGNFYNYDGSPISW